MLDHTPSENSTLLVEGPTYNNKKSSKSSCKKIAVASALVLSLVFSKFIHLLLFCFIGTFILLVVVLAAVKYINNHNDEELSNDPVERARQLQKKF